MADLLIITERPDDLRPLANGLETGGHRVRLMSPAEAEHGEADPALAIVDAAKDLARGRDLARGLAERNPRLHVLVVVGAEAIDAVGPDWLVTSFVVEPVSIPETLARVRLAIGTQTPGSDRVVAVGDLAIDPDTYQVRLRTRPLDLTYKEFQLLFFLAKRPGRVYSRQQLLQEVWGYDYFGGTRTVDVHVRRLRAKLGAEHEGMIVTIRNVGYKLEAHRSR